MQQRNSLQYLVSFLHESCVVLLRMLPGMLTVPDQKFAEESGHGCLQRLFFERKSDPAFGSYHKISLLRLKQVELQFKV